MAVRAQRGRRARGVPSRDRDTIKLAEQGVRRQGKARRCLQMEGSRRRGICTAFHASPRAARACPPRDPSTSCSRPHRTSARLPGLSLPPSNPRRSFHEYLSVTYLVQVLPQAQGLSSDRTAQRPSSHVWPCTPARPRTTGCPIPGCPRCHLHQISGRFSA